MSKDTRVSPWSHAALYALGIVLLLLSVRWGRSAWEETRLAHASVEAVRAAGETARRDALEAAARAQAREAEAEAKAAELERVVSAQRAEIERLAGELGKTDLYKKHRLQVSAYTASRRECDATPEVTALNLKPVVGRSVGVSRDLKHWLGKWVYIEGFGVRQVTDLMNPRYVQSVDLLVGTEREARKVGRRRAEVVLLGDKPKEVSGGFGGDGLEHPDP